MFEDCHSDRRFTSVVQLLQLGRLDEAWKTLETLSPESPALDEAAYLRFLIRRAGGARKSAERPLLVWQYDAFERWEGQYLRELTSGVIAGEKAEYHAYSHVGPRMIVVDNHLGDQVNAYIRRAALAGADIVLFHLGDEAYIDDCSCYRWCRAVYRNYWSVTQARNSNVRFLPLGYKAGFSNGEAIRPVTERRYVWSFCGDLNKTTRGSMNQHMTALEPNYLHVTSGWDAPDLLPVEQYRDIMDQSIFVPCGQGFCTPDSFRVYEALEAGCIPIVERTAEFDYFAGAYGDHPMPVIRDWAEAPSLVSAILASGQAPALARRCHAWWIGLKAQVTASLRAEFPG